MSFDHMQYVQDFRLVNLRNSHRLGDVETLRSARTAFLHR